MTGKKCFTGIEVEGCAKGRPTLFIPSVATISFEKIKKVCASKNISRVYFGAGGYRGVGSHQLDVFRDCLDACFDVAVEVNDVRQIAEVPLSLRRRAWFIYTFDVINADRVYVCREVREVKWQTKTELYQKLFRMDPIDVVYLNDPMYGHDEVVNDEVVM
jgi:hypothetical protein